jgi:hypothetical protein
MTMHQLQNPVIPTWKVPPPGTEDANAPGWVILAFVNKTIDVQDGKLIVGSHVAKPGMWIARVAGEIILLDDIRFRQYFESIPEKVR